MTSGTKTPRPGSLGGVGIGWREPLADLLTDLATRGRLGFSEVIAERIGDRPPEGVREVLDRSVPVIAHGVGLGLAGAHRPDPARLARLTRAAQVLGSPLVSEHVAFVRASAPAHDPRARLHADVLEAGHLVPGPRTRQSLRILVANVRETMAELPVPLALENPASTLPWPEDELDEITFLSELVQQTGCWLLLDLANLRVSAHTDALVGRRTDPVEVLTRIPWERVAYTHVAGGAEHDGILLDTHAHPIADEVYWLVAQMLDASPDPPGVLIERDSQIDPVQTEAEWQRLARMVDRTDREGR